MTAPLELICPYCDREILVADDVWKHSCSYCGEIIDVSAHFAYLRGLDAFNEGQEIFQKINPRKRRFYLAADREALDIFMQAYSSFQVAFKGELEENQRMLAVEMMTSMTQEFLKRLMVSPMEAQYWNTLMVEQTARNEYDRLKMKLSKEISGLWGAIKRWRWNGRKNKLAKTFSHLENKLKALEKQIDFIDIPHARDRHWEP